MPLTEDHLNRATLGLALALAISVATMVIAAGVGSGVMAACAAASFVVALLVAAFRMLRTPGRHEQDLPGGMTADVAHARLSALAYGWSAIAMQALYITPLTGLRWQHGWQYALAFGLLAVAAIWAERYVRDVGQSVVFDRAGPRWWQPLIVAQAVLSLAAVMFMVASGKLATLRPDWAANQVFLAAAVMIFGISAQWLKQRLGRRSTP